MIDLETLSTRQTAAFQQIGWASFYRGKVHDSGVIFVNPQTCIDKGMHVEWETIVWWMKQDATAQGYFTHPGLPLRDALMNFGGVIDTVGPDYIWSHGVRFDLGILSNAYQLCDLALPWDFRSERDTRTLYMTSPLFAEEKTKPFIEHSAQHDAMAQAEDVMRCLEDKTV